MTNIKALGELRRAVKKGKAVAFPSGEAYYDAIDECMDEIEREVSERFMPLPCDADGAPIHCGDRMRLDNGHEGEVWLIGAQDIMMSDHTCFDWARSRHVKPRTLEDVLAAFAAELHSDRIDSLDRRIERCAARYADEIRELMGVGE